MVLEQKEVTLRGLGGSVAHQAPNGISFAVGDLLTAIVATERQTREHSEWYEGVDVHHIFFEGIWVQILALTDHRFSPKPIIDSYGSRSPILV